MSDTRWLNNRGGSLYTTTSNNSQVVLTYGQANSLAPATFNVSVSSLIFGDFTKWCSSLIYYPIIINNTTNTSKLNAGGIEYNVDVQMGGIPALAYTGFFMGQYEYPEAETFLDYEPYTNVEIWLPYYGFAPLKIVDISGQHIQVRLYIDWQTGLAQYVVGVNPSSVVVASPPYNAGIDDTNTRIIGTYNFQFGVVVPISSANFNEIVRNTVMSVGKAVGSIGSSLISDTLPTSSQTSTSKTVNTKRSEKTGRQVQSDTSTTTRSTESRNYDTSGRLNTAVSTSSTVLGNLSMKTSGITSNNGALNQSQCLSVAIVTRKAKPTIDIMTDSNYKHLNGLPNGTCSQLSTLSGYTTISNIHIEGSDFSQATQEELLMLESTVLQGIIL